MRLQTKRACDWPSKQPLSKSVTGVALHLTQPHAGGGNLAWAQNQGQKSPIHCDARNAEHAKDITESETSQQTYPSTY